MTAASSRLRRPEADDGVVAIVVAIVVVGVVVPLMAIVVDLGLTRMLAGQSRGAADAAALAAAGTAKANESTGDLSQADSDARALVQANLPAPPGGWTAAWATCIDPTPLPTIVGSGSCISFDSMLKRVRVTVPQRNVPIAFSGVLGVSSLHAAATTTATWGLDPSPTCALCVFGNYTGGRKGVQVTGDNVLVGGDLNVSSAGSLIATGGQVRFGGHRYGSGTVSPTPIADTRPIGDPYAATLDALSRTTPNGLPVYGQRASTVPPNSSCAPGIYQDITNCTTITGNGTYFVTGRPGTNVNVSLNADASQVLLFFTCSAGGVGPVVAAPCSPWSTMPRLVGTNRTITAETGSDLAVVFDAGLTRSQRLSGSGFGAGGLTINGSVYGPNATLGGSGSTQATVNGHVVVAGVSFSTFGSSGTTVLQVTVPPPTPQPVPDGPVRLAGG